MDYKKIAVISITIILVVLLILNLDLKLLAKAFLNIPIGIIIVSFVIYFFSHIFRSLRFKILLNNKVCFKDVFYIVGVHNFLNTLLPFRSGELSYVYLMKKKGVAGAEALSNIIVSRIFDFFAIFSIFFLCIFFIKDIPPLIVGTMWIIGISFIAVVIFYLLIIFVGGGFISFLSKISEKTKLKLLRFLFKKSTETLEYVTKVRSKKILAYLYGCSLIVFLLTYIVNWLVLKQIIGLSFFEISVGATFSILTSILPIHGVGGFGTTESAWVLAFVAFGISLENAIVSGFIVHIWILIFLTIMGIVGFKMGNYKWRERL